MRPSSSWRARCGRWRRCRLRSFDEAPRRFPTETLHGGDDFPEPDLARVVHRPAAVHREAVAREVDHVHVRGALRDALLHDLRALVDQRVDAALDDFLVADLPSGNADLL